METLTIPRLLMIGEPTVKIRPSYRALRPVDDGQVADGISEALEDTCKPVPGVLDRCAGVCAVPWSIVARRQSKIARGWRGHHSRATAFVPTRSYALPLRSARWIFSSDLFCPSYRSEGLRFRSVMARPPCRLTVDGVVEIQSTDFGDASTLMTALRLVHHDHDVLPEHCQIPWS